MKFSEVPAIGFLVWRLSLRWRAAVDRALAPLKLTHAQYALLASLYGLSRAGGRPSQRELSDFSGLEPMYVSKLARRLEAAGLLERTGNPVDPRAVQLTLTDRGEHDVTRAMRRVLDLQEEITSPLGGLRTPRSRELTQTLLALLGETSQRTPTNAMEKDAMNEQLPVTGQVIGEAHKAIEPLLGLVLKAVGTTFPAWVTLNTLATGGSAPTHDELVREVAGGQNASEESVGEVVDRLCSDGLIQEMDGLIELAPPGRDLHARIGAQVVERSERLYAGLEVSELATTRRVLVEVTRRARAMRAEPY